MRQSNCRIIDTFTWFLEYKFGEYCLNPALLTSVIYYWCTSASDVHAHAGNFMCSAMNCLPFVDLIPFVFHVFVISNAIWLQYYLLICMVSVCICWMSRVGWMSMWFSAGSKPEQVAMLYLKVEVSKWLAWISLKQEFIVFWRNMEWGGCLVSWNCWPCGPTVYSPIFSTFLSW